jgi:hypothetical protein
MAQQRVQRVNVNTVTELFYVGEKLNGDNWTICIQLAPYVEGTLQAPKSTRSARQPTSIIGNFNNDLCPRIVCLGAV